MVSETCERRALGAAPDGGAARGAGGKAGLTLAQAEDLLDWLEAHGYTGLEASLGEGGVTVSWDGPFDRPAGVAYG